MMKPEDLTIEDLEKKVGIPTDQWHGKCTLIAHFAQKLVGGHSVYGHYLGPIDPHGYWGGRRGFPNHHGWVLLDDGRILDPTRWSFEDEAPYIYIGDNDDDYDEGSNRVRASFRRPCPPPEGEPAKVEANKTVYSLFEHLTNTPFEKMTRDQFCWVANADYEELDFAVADIYQTLIDNDMSAYIPFDNLERAKREGRVK